jgi:hypothetical protein
VTVDADPDPSTGPQAAHFKVDGGPEQTIATTGNPGQATLQLPPGVHSVEYWGEDQLGLQEPTLHTVNAGCAAGSGGAPKLTSAALSSKTFRAARSGPSLARAPVGTTVTYNDSAGAVTTFKVLSKRIGHRKHGRCVAGRRAHGRCTRYVSLGSFTHHDAAGAVSVHFSGRVRRHALKPGRYRLSLTPRAGGKRGRTINLAFRIVR